MSAEKKQTHDISPEQQEGLLDNPSRRKLFKRAAVGGGAALALGMGGYAAGRASVEGMKNPNWPQLADDFKPHRQEDLIFSNAVSPLVQRRNPTRHSQFGTLVKGDPNYRMQQVEKGWDNQRVGFTQRDWALNQATWFAPNKWELRLNGMGQPNTEYYSWDQSKVEKEQYQFASKQEATDSIRAAARLFGAARVGITRRDRRWDYEPLLDLGISAEMAELVVKKGRLEYQGEKFPAEDMQRLGTMMKGMKDRELSWDEDFPFEPKSVIVLAVPQDYDAFGASPSYVGSAAAGDGYTRMMTLASSMARFLQGMGYKAVASGNDLGNSVAYGIAAGLGEGGRNNQLIVPGYGPRVRLCKVYTEFDFFEYDEPRTWGIEEFCKSCKKCAEACPSHALDMADDTHYYFEGEHADQPGYAWSNNQGIKKFHTDAKKCFDYWIESNTGCGACTAACTFNEPDYWHHWFIMAINPFVPSALHAAMAELHPAFGYGSTQDPAKVEKFWKLGQGMRVNKHGRNIFGAVGAS